MTPLYHRVQTILDSYQAQSETTVDSDADLHKTAEGLQTFILIVTIDLTAMLKELQTLDHSAPLFRKRGKHVRPILQYRQDLAACIAGLWQALNEVCTVFLEHSAEAVVTAVCSPLAVRMADFRSRWPQAQPYSAFYPGQRDTLVALWHHLAPLPPTTAAQQH